MKIKTKLTLFLLVSFCIVIIIFVGVIGHLSRENQRSYLDIFKSELLNENARLIEESAELFFKLMDMKIMEGKSKPEILEYIKEIDQLNRSVVVFDFSGQSLLRNHSRKEFITFLSKEEINHHLQQLQRKNKKNFSLDNFTPFMESTGIISPQKIYYQIYNSLGIIIGYGRLLEDIKTRLLFLERKNQRNERDLLLITFSIIIVGISLIIAATLIFSRKSIFNPLETLIVHFERVARGEFFHQVEVRSDDEIGRLSAAFNHMTEQLNHSVNEIKAINIKLDNYSRELESRVERRTKELSTAVEQLKREIEERKVAEIELRQARIESESANRAKTQFLANMSHEIRTPMNAIIGMSELVMETELSLEQEEYIYTLKSSAESLLCLLNDILDLSKIEVGKLDIEPIGFNFRDNLAEVAKNLFIHKQQKEIELIYDIALDIPDIMIGDPSRLRQILTNLIGNAIKFTKEGIVLLKVFIEDEKPATPDTAEELNLHFSISDTGIGIPEDKQKLIFEKFTQSDSSITRRFGGSGLGLAISLQLVQIMGGTLWVQSPGELHDIRSGGPGSTFHFILSYEVPKYPIETDFKQPQQLNINKLKGIPVLVVDDNPINRKIFKELLERWGLTPQLVDDGIKALEVLNQAAAEKKPFQLILVDVQMPMMDGFELTQCIRENKTLENPQIIILTSAGVKGDGKRCRALNVAAYLRKPVPSSELLETLLIVMGDVTREKKDSKVITKYWLQESRSRINLLVVEDNLINQKLIKRILEKRDYLVDIANDGKEAVEKLSLNNYDLVLMDIQMPEMDGIEATRLIRKREKEIAAPPTPIIALTAHAMKGDKERFLAVGMNSYISKPIKQSDLLETIEKLIYEKPGYDNLNPLGNVK